MEQFLHGAQVVEIDGGSRPIKSASSGVIGVVGTAPDSDDTFPINTPVVIAGSRSMAAKLGTEGTLPTALDGIFDQVGAIVVVIRVEDNDPLTVSDNVDTGVLALLSAENVAKVEPRILIAPGFSNQKAIADQLINVADQLRGYALLDGPDTTDAAAITYAEVFGSKRSEVIDPWYNIAGKGVQPPSPYHAGVMAKVHSNKGFWWSNSNQEIYGVDSLTRPISFKLDNPVCAANLLNEKNVTTTIQQSGFRVWGNRTCSADPKWVFKNVVITADMIADSLARAHLWAIDRNITKTYIQDVSEGVKSYLRHLTAIGAIAGGDCWADPELNTPDQIQQGKVTFDFDFSTYSPAESITFRSHMVDGYLKEII